MNGTITTYKADRGFGFVRLSDGDDIFFHVSDWPPDSQPQVGQAIEFRLGRRNGRQIALDIKLMAAVDARGDA